MPATKPSGKVLLVDDDPTLVDSVSRMLGRKFDMSTALCGPAALETLGEQGPFAVVVTDMRMPGMDGVEFIGRARELCPQTVFMMLTGNQDVGTALRAVNEGEAFRVLHKPCRNADLSRAIMAGQCFYRAVTAEQTLLSETLVGATAAQINLLARANPDLGRIVTGFAELVTDLTEGVGLDHRWEVKLAAQLAPLGLALAANARAKATNKAGGRASHNDALSDAATAMADEFAKVPRLEAVAEMLRSIPRADGAIKKTRVESDDEIMSVGASLLRVAAEACFARAQGSNGAEVADAVEQALPATPRALLDVLERDGLTGHKPVDLALPAAAEADSGAVAT